MEELRGEVFVAPAGGDPLLLGEVVDATVDASGAHVTIRDDAGQVANLDGFQSIGTLAHFRAADLTDEIEGGEWAGEPLKLDLAPRTITAEATFHGDAALKIRRELARACGAPIPTTSGSQLDPHTERRAAIRAIRARHVLELAGAKRSAGIPAGPVPWAVVREGSRRNGKGQGK